MIRCVVFDFDGTLVDSNQIKRETFFELAGEFEGGVPLMAEVMKEAADRDRYWIFARFAALSGQVDPVEMAERYTQACQKRITSAPEIPGARVSLEYLRQDGKLLFVNSATPKAPLARLMHLRQMEKWFAGIYGSPAKKQENLEVIRAKHGFVREEMLVVGDGESDRISAEIIGCHFVALDSAENNFLHKPFCRIPDLNRLPDLIFSNSYCQQKNS